MGIMDMFLIMGRAGFRSSAVVGPLSRSVAQGSHCSMGNSLHSGARVVWAP